MLTGSKISQRLYRLEPNVTKEKEYVTNPLKYLKQKACSTRYAGEQLNKRAEGRGKNYLCRFHHIFGVFHHFPAITLAL